MAAHPTAANLLMAIFVFLGVLAAPKLQRETFPDFTASEAEIVVVYPGARPEDVEESICQDVEDAVERVTDVEEVRCEALENQARAVVEMRDGGDLSRFLDELQTEVDSIDTFPAEAEAPIIRELGRTSPVISVAVTGPMSLSHLKLYCESLKSEMLRSGEISQVEVLGFSDHQIRIEVAAGRLRQFGLSIGDIVDAIRRQNVDLPAGDIEARDGNISIRFDDQRRTPDEYGELLVISGKTGAEVPLKELATIHYRFELAEEKVLVDGERACLLAVNKLKNDDALRIRDAVEAFVNRAQAQAPPTVRIALTQDQAEVIRDRLRLLSVNGIQGLLLVMGAMWLFFSFRISFWVGMGLPVSFLGTLFVMQAIGFSLNLMTMVGLLMAVGLIMDDAVVIAENIAVHVERGRAPLEAVVHGVAEVAPGVLSSFATTVAIFGTIALLVTGTLGKILWVMPVVLVATLTVSLLEAFLILPRHLVHAVAYTADPAPSSFRARFERVVATTREDWVGKGADWAVEHRYLFLGAVLGFFLFSVALIPAGMLKFWAFPEIEGDVLEARILLPQGTPLERTEGVVNRFVLVLEEINAELTPLQPEGRALIPAITVRTNRNADAFESGPHVATVTADLLGAEIRNTSIDEVSSRWRAGVGEVPDLVHVTYREPTISPAGLPIEIRLQGTDLDELKGASLELHEWLRAYDGVLDLSDDLRPGKPELTARLKPGALTRGVNAGSIAAQLRAAFYGETADDLQAGGEPYEIDVRLRPADQDSLADLDAFLVTTADGEQVPLRSVVTLVEGRGYARIHRINGLRTVTLQGDLDSAVANANEILADTTERFLPGFLERHPGVEISLQGESESGAETAQSLILAFIIGVFGIFVLLSLQLESYVAPLAIMVAIPLAFVGVVWGHVVMGLWLSTISMLGFVSLAGIVVNDSILLVAFIRQSIEAGQSVAEAATLASRRRFRPVLITSVTTILGLLPLMSERSPQAQTLIPLAVSVVFGLLASTLLVLFVIPALYTILADLGLVHGSQTGSTRNG